MKKTEWEQRFSYTMKATYCATLCNMNQSVHGPGSGEPDCQFHSHFFQKETVQTQPSNHALIQSERLNARGNKERCAVLQYTPSQPMKVLFSSDDRIRRLVV